MLFNPDFHPLIDIMPNDCSNSLFPSTIELYTMGLKLLSQMIFEFKQSRRIVVLVVLTFLPSLIYRFLKHRISTPQN